MNIQYYTKGRKSTKDFQPSIAVLLPGKDIAEYDDIEHVQFRKDSVSLRTIVRKAKSFPSGTTVWAIPWKCGYACIRIDV